MVFYTTIMIDIANGVGFSRVGTNLAMWNGDGPQGL